MILVVYGPTACGKTALSLDLAEQFHGEIISADSRQIFCGMDIGTGKIKTKEMRGIPHHCIDIALPNQEFSAIEWKNAAQMSIQDIESRGKTPIICGGTGLYLDVLLFDFDVPKVPPNPELRAKLQKFRRENGNDALWNMLVERDPEYALKIHPNNYRYIERAIEVLEETGTSKSAQRSERRLRYPHVVFTTPYNDENRSELYTRIDTRVNAMFDHGLVEEARELIKKYGSDAFGLKTIGYNEVVKYLEGTMSFDATVALIQKNTRNYAKRQITWNKRYSELAHLPKGGK